MFNENCAGNFPIGEDVCIDETLLACKSRCPFLLFMPNKPSKHGILFHMCVDSTTKYLHRARIYLGKNVETEGNLGENIVRELVGDLLGKGRKVCCDNFFTSPSLGQFLYQAKTFLIGTIRANRKGLPKGYGNQALEVNVTKPFLSYVSFLFFRKANANFCIATKKL